MINILKNEINSQANKSRPKLSVFIATSLDGFIARKNGDLDWLDKCNSKVPPGEDCGYKEFIKTIDIIVMGRFTYEKVRTFGTWPYGSIPVIVLSSTKLEIPAELRNSVESSSLSPHDLVESLSNRGIKHLYIDGGITIQRFLKSGLIDELTITIAPVVLGEGRPLFAPLEEDVSLIHIETKSFSFGFVQLKYCTHALIHGNPNQ